ncbi:uncharacterized protein LOC143285226 [Babylonia areolata]|uniref:uncharacterized protein LOC143285226 n=1 Tax=Babylonia areolata TaxID=304850 RepID=UPI003FCFBF1F
MERHFGALFFLALVATLCGLFTEVVVGETCTRAVTREKSVPANLSHPGHFLPQTRRTWDWSEFDCDNGCCGKPPDQYCCPDDDDDDDSDDDDTERNVSLVTGLSVSIVIVIVTVVVVTIGCMCFRARHKRASAHRVRRPPTVSTTPASATLPPSYEMSIIVPDAPPPPPPPGTTFPSDSPPAYEEVVMAAGRPGAPPPTLPPRNYYDNNIPGQTSRGTTDRATESSSSGRIEGRDNLGFTMSK